MVHLSEILNGIIDEIFLGLAVISFEIDLIEIILDVIFTILIDVRPINQTKGLDHDRETAFQAIVTNLNKFPGEGV